MNICILAARFPYPEIGGDALRINNVAKYLKASGHHVFLITFYGEKIPDVETAKQLYEKIVMIKRSPIESLLYSFVFLLRKKPVLNGYFYSPRYLKAFKHFIKDNSIDLLVPHSLRLTEYIVRLGLENKTIVEQTDALSKTYTLSEIGRGNSLKKIIYKIEKRLVPRYEEFMLKTFKKVVYVSDSDVRYLTDKYPWQRVAVCHTNGFDLPDNTVEEYDQYKICLMGNMRTLPNQDAAIFFVEKVLPIILQAEPKVKFYIVGAEPSKTIENLTSDHVIVTGFVDSVERFISDACLCVAPVRIAAGIQNKVLVSMGCGVPVILSSLIAQPIPELFIGENCFIEDEPQQIAERCLLLIRNRQLRNSIAVKGREMVRDHYSWNKTLEGYTVFPPTELV